MALVVGVAACRSAPPPSGADSASAFTAVVRLDDAGVVLDADDGAHLRVTDPSVELWKAFAGRRVEASGAREGGAVRVATLHVRAPTPDDPYVSIGPELTLRGRFREYVWPAGTKLEGEHETRFTDERGKMYAVENQAAGAPRDREVDVKGRVVGLSPHSAHAHDEALWVSSVAQR